MLPINQDRQSERKANKVMRLPQPIQLAAVEWREHRPAKWGEMKRHWHPLSERYAGFDALVSALDQGWTIIGTLCQATYRLTSGCRTTVYHFTLQRGDDKMKMPVINNPCLARFITACNLAFIPSVNTRHVHSAPPHGPALQTNVVSACEIDDQRNK